MRTIAMTLTGFMGAFAGGQAALWGHQIRCQQPELATLRWQGRAILAIGMLHGDLAFSESEQITASKSERNGSSVSAYARRAGPMLHPG